MDEPLVSAVVFSIGIALVLVIYFIPTFVANSRGSDKTTAIFFLNLLLGWTFLGWVGALVWSLALPRAKAESLSDD